MSERDRKTAASGELRDYLPAMAADPDPGKEMLPAKGQRNGGALKVREPVCVRMVEALPCVQFCLLGRLETCAID